MLGRPKGQWDDQDLEFWQRENFDKEAMYFIVMPFSIAAFCVFVLRSHQGNSFLTDDHVPDLICVFSTYRNLSVTTDGINQKIYFKSLNILKYIQALIIISCGKQTTIISLSDMY